MRIISHRGYWLNSGEKNQRVAFERSFKLGFGTETDVRDCKGTLVISHDPPGGLEMPIDEFLSIYNQYENEHLPLALNIKSDGLQSLLVDALSRANVVNYFVFDMSVPDMRQCLAKGLRTFTRMSEFEAAPACLDESAGVWVDCFFSEWIEEYQLSDLLNKGKLVCLVSPELHQRKHLDFWTRLAHMQVCNSEGLLLCTDLPEDARSFFAP